MLKKLLKSKNVKSFATLITRLWWAWVLAAMVVVFGLTMILAIGQPIWFDEGYSILLAQQPWPDMFALAAVDAHPPLYYMLLKVWGSLFGWSEFALRSLSALLMAGAVGVGLVLVRRLFTPRVALATLPFLVAAPFVLRYGYEVRMYALAALIGVLATLVMMIAVRQQRWRYWAIYGVLVTLGMLTLYLTVAVWLTHAVWLLVRSIRRKEPIRSWRWLVALTGSVALFVPYVPIFFSQLFNSVLPGVGSEVTLTKLVDVFTTLVVYTSEWMVDGWLSLLLLAMAVLAVVLTVKVHPRLRGEAREGFMLVVWLVLIPILFFALTSLVGSQPIFINRYMAHVALFFYLLLGLLVALGWRYKQHLLSVSLAVLSLALLLTGVVRLAEAGNFNSERQQQPSTIELRQAFDCTDTTAVADDPYTYIDTVYYFDDCNLKFYSAENVENRGGYAPLHDSVDRIESSADVSSKHLIHVRWAGAEPSFDVGSEYWFIDSVQKDKQVIDRYLRVNVE